MTWQRPSRPVQRQHFYLHAKADDHDRHAPEQAQDRQMVFAARGGHQQQQAGEQQANGAAHKQGSMLITQLAKQHAADNARTAEDEQ